MSGLDPDDFLPYIEELTKAGLNFLIVGGQAASLVAKRYLPEQELLEESPLTSKDLDVSILPIGWKEPLGRLSGELISTDSPADGIFKVWRPVPDRRVDILTFVYGLPHDQFPLFERAIRMEDGPLILHPFDQMQSKAACWKRLQADDPRRQDDKHFRIVTHSIPGLLGEMLEGLNEENQRAMIKALKWLQDVLADRTVKEALEATGIDPSGLFPMGRLKSCGWPKVEKFAVHSL